VEKANLANFDTLSNKPVAYFEEYTRLASALVQNQKLPLRYQKIMLYFYWLQLLLPDN